VVRWLPTALIALLSAFALLPAAIEPVVATSWDVRRDAQELLEDLAKPGDTAPLLERIQAMLAEHGDKLIHHGTWFAPLSEVLAERLAARGLGKDFIAAYGDIADRRLRQLLEARAEDGDVRRLARTYPGTPAAARAWAWLANRSWDRGQLGQYLAYARQAGEPGDRTLSARVEAARKLLSPAMPSTVPTALDLEEMWRIDLDETEAKPQRPPALRPGRLPTGKRAFALSEPRDDLTAASDGRHVFLVDHLLGRIQGVKHPLGDTWLSVRQCTPAAGNDCFVAIGMLQPARATLVCVDRLGELRWHITTPGFGPYPTLSAPRICDDLVVFAALAINEDGPELRAYAYRLADGKAAWDVLIAKLPNLIHHRGFDESRFGSLAPTLCSHAGSLLVLSNAGVIARLSSGGAVERIWTYPSALTAIQEPLGLPARPGREGALHSDGYWAVATPADADLLTLILGPDDLAPRQYTGDGSSGEVLDVADGIALLGGKQVHCLDLKQGRLRWSRPPALEDRASGRIGSKRALVCGRERLSLIDLASGDLIDDKGVDAPIAFSTAEGLLMIGGRASIIAWGNTRASLDEQLAAVQRNPKDFRPLIRLYSLLQAQGDSAKAYDYLVQALQRGAPPEYSEKAARLVRLRLETALGDAEAFPPLLTQLSDLAVYNPGLGTEAALWRGRHAEARKETAAAVSAYQLVLKQPTLRLVLGDRLETQAQCLAQAGLHRLKLIDPPAWLGDIARPLPALAVPTSAWTLPGRRRRGELITSDLVIGYVDGLLTAQRLSDGKTVWRRKPVRPLLGVQTMQVGNAQRGGIAVQVIEGTSAEVAGIRTGDVLVEFNGKPLAEFPDLVNAVSDTGADGAFTAKVQRAGQVLALTGRLGGDLVEPVAANATSVLVWPMFPERNSSEGMWITAHDLATGNQLWHGTLPPVTADQPPQRPVLTPGDMVLTADGDDLIGMALRGANGTADERWRLRGLGAWLGQCQLLGATLALIADAGHGQARIIDTSSGESLFAMPADGEVPALLAGGELYARLLDNRLACWDLGQARLRWKSEKPVHAALAAAGDAVFVLGDRKQLMVVDRFSGKVRRLYGDWGALDEWQVAGDRLYAYVRRADLSQALVAIGVPSGAVLWELGLPRGAQLKKLTASTEGVAAVIEDREETAVIMLRPDGSTRQAHLLDGSDNAWFLRGSLLVVGRAGMRVLSPVAPPIAPTVPCIQVPPLADLETTALAALPRLTWQPLGAAAYALARSDQALLVYARLPASVESIEIRLGDAGPLIDPLNQELVIQRHKISKFADLPDAWQQAGAIKLPAPGDDWLYVVRLVPPQGRGVGVPVELRAVAGTLSDSSEGPWWYRPLWRQVATPTIP